MDAKRSAGLQRQGILCLFLFAVTTGMAVAAEAATSGPPTIGIPCSGGIVLEAVSAPSTAGVARGVAVVPGNKAGFSAIPLLLVTACGGNSLLFIDPANPATPVSSLSTGTFLFEALAFRPGTTNANPAEPPDLLGCVSVEGGTSLYAIHFSPLDSTTAGTVTFLANAPSNSTCDGIAWDPADKTVYQTTYFNASSNPPSDSGILHFAFTTPSGTTPATSITDGCGAQVTGVGVAGTRLFVGCGGASPTVRQLDKAGNVVRSFGAPTSSMSGLPDDAATFSAQFQEALWTLVGNQFVAIFVPRDFAVQPGGCPAGFPTDAGKPIDTDGDGILDCWEARTWPPGTTPPDLVGTNIWPDGLPGIDIDGDGVRDLVLCVTNVNGAFECADPNVKDIFVEFDSMTNQPANVAALTQVVTAFANAPVDNPAPGGSGPKGIRLHIQKDDQNLPFSLNTAFVPCTPPNTYPFAADANFDALKAAWFGTAAERPASGDSPQTLLQKQKTRFAKSLVFHYGMSVKNLTRQGEPLAPSPSGCAEIPGNDFVVSLGSFGAGNGTQDQWSGTFMHELGHNLGLFHGGGDRTNCKPNYLSVMQYALQFSNIVVGRPLDYSRVDLPDLNEAALVPAAGIGVGLLPPGTKTVYGSSTSPFTAIVVDATGAINWNAPSASASPVSDNVNRIGSGTGCDGSGGGGVDTGFNDWANLVFNFRAHPDFSDGHLSPEGNEMTPDQYDELTSLADADGDGVPDSAACGEAACRIDVVPGFSNNPVVLFNYNGTPTAVVPVAVLSSAAFDATTVNPLTLKLQGTPVSMVFGKPACITVDVNHDRLRDLVCAFTLKGLSLGYAEAILEGKTFVGKSIRGQDFMNVVPLPVGDH